MSPEPLILAIETSAAAGSTALLRGEQVLAERRFDPGVRGGNLLHPGVLAVLDGATPDLVATGIGPGSYTGGRIGVVFAKAYAFARGIPLASVSALEAIAQRACLDGACAVLMQAHPGHVYAALYACAPGAAPRAVRPPALVARDAFLAELAGGETIIEAPPEQSWAADVGKVAARRGLAARVADPGALEPLYLQVPSPERVLASGKAQA